MSGAGGWIAGRRSALREALSGYRNVLAVVAGLTVLQASMAALSVAVALALRAQGASDAAIGLVASAFAGGFLLGAILSPREIARIGHIRAYAVFAVIAALGALGFAFDAGLAAYVAIQIVLGHSCAGLLASGESWIADSAPPHRRGAIIGFYHLVSKTGAVAGPFIVAATASGDPRYMVVAALFAASVLPIAATGRQQPQVKAASPFGPRKILAEAPAAAVAAFVAGATNNAVGQLYPVFAAAAAPENAAGFAALFNAAMTAGAMTGLWPAGFISDRVDRRLVIATLALVGAAASAALAFLDPAVAPRATILLLAAAFGAGSLSYYGVAVAHAADRARPEQTTSMMAGILVIWGLGSVIGPAFAGTVMSLAVGPSGLFAFTSVALTLMAAFVFLRALRAEPAPAAEKEPFKPAPATSLAIAELDPRGETEQLDLFRHAPAETAS